MTPEHGGRLKAMPEARDTGANSVIPPHLVRLARMDDLGTLVAIEVAAGAAFRDLGMDAVADDDPGSVEDLEPYVRRVARSLLWIRRIGRSVICWSMPSMVRRTSSR